MRYYFAPMEGITDSIYRSLHHAHFGGVDRYYMPFLSPTQHRSLTPKEARELFHIQPGDTLLILGEEETGLIVSRPEVLSDLASK